MQSSGIGLLDAFDAATSTVYEFSLHKKQLLIYMHLSSTYEFNSHTEEVWHTEIPTNTRDSDGLIVDAVGTDP